LQNYSNGDFNKNMLRHFASLDEFASKTVIYNNKLLPLGKTLNLLQQIYLGCSNLILQYNLQIFIYPEFSQVLIFLKHCYYNAIFEIPIEIVTKFSSEFIKIELSLSNY